MKKIISTFAAMLIASVAVSQVIDHDDKPSRHTHHEGLKFCEGTTTYRNHLLISNFGGTELNPLNNNGKGYIVSVSNDDKQKVLIPADGNLSAPKGMVVVGNYLYIADVCKVVVYNLKELNQKPQIINFPADDLFVNDVAQLGDMVLVSVTNTGRLYGIDVTNPKTVSTQTPRLIGNIPGANGLAVAENMIYIASYAPDEKPNAQNVIYAYNMYDQKKPMSKLITNLAPGQYDGIAVSTDGKSLVFSSWGNGTKENPAGIFIYNLDGKSDARRMELGVDFKGPADITIKGDYLYVPDLPASTVYRFPL